MKVVCFDLGGVLVRIALNVAEAGRRAGVGGLPDVSFGDLPCLLDYQKGKLTSAEYAVVLSEVLQVSPEDAALVHDHILVEPYEGTFELIRGLEGEYLTACLSNTNDLHWIEMMESDRFPNVRRLQLPVASHLVKLEKPHVEMYRKFEELCGYSGSDIVFFDDGKVNVEAAREMGWNAHWIDPGGDTASQMASILGLG